MQAAGSGPEWPSTAKFATLPVTISGHPGNLGQRRFNGRHQARHVRRSLSTYVLDGRSVCVRREYVDGMPASGTRGSHPAWMAGHEATLQQGLALACGRGADSPVSARVPAGNPARQD